MYKSHSLGSFIRKRPYLVWYVKDLGSLSEDAVMEAVLNYGDFDDVRKLLFILGIKKAAKIFYRHAKQKRCNYDPKIANYFKLYFKQYA